jgi:hypothetical protein
VTPHQTVDSVCRESAPRKDVCFNSCPAWAQRQLDPIGRAAVGRRRRCVRRVPSLR